MVLRAAAFICFFYAQSVSLATGQIGQPMLSPIAAIDSINNFAYDLMRQGQFEQATTLAKKALAMSASKRYDLGESDSYSIIGTCYKYMGKYAMSIGYHKKALRIRKRVKSHDKTAGTMNNIGICYSHAGKLDSAILYLDSSRMLRTKISSPKLHNTLGSLANLYFQLEEYDRAAHFYRLQLRITQDNQDTLKSSEVLLSLGKLMLRKNALDSAEFFLKRSSALKRRIQDSSGQAEALLSIGIYYLGINQPKPSRSCLLQAFELFQKTNNSIGQISCINNLALLDLENDPRAAVNQWQHSLRMFGDIHDYSLLEPAYYNLSIGYEMLGMLDSALHFERLHSELEKSNFNKETRRQIEELEAKYQLAELRAKKLAVVNQSNIIKQKNRRLMILSISIASAFIISILIGLLFYQRLQRKRAMEKLAFELEGQEQERGRIAQELHDGLGSLLSTVKHHFEVIEDKMDTKTSQYQAAQNLLDKACDEVRRISHDMASNVLGKFGLVAALNDLSDEITSTGSLKMELIVSGLDERLDNLTEFHLFRVIQELVGNTLKHAQASKVSVQLTRHENSLNVLVEDNGIGFDKELISKQNGMGLSNLKARIDRINGTYNLDSNIGHGTTIIINIPLKS